jgi:hypothetical protein
VTVKIVHSKQRLYYTECPRTKLDLCGASSRSVTFSRPIIRVLDLTVHSSPVVSEDNRCCARGPVIPHESSQTTNYNSVRVSTVASPIPVLTGRRRPT